MQYELLLDGPDDRPGMDDESIRERAKHNLWDNPFEDPSNKITPQQYARKIEEIYRRTPEYMIRDGDWSAMVDEQRAVRNYYAEQNRPAPLSTERRFGKHVAAFKESWQLEKADPPVSERRMLDDYDLKHPEESWNDLRLTNDLITHHYAVAGMDIPLETTARMDNDVRDYLAEIKVYEMEQDIAQVTREQQSAPNRADSFKEELEKMRNRQKPLIPGPG